MFKKMKNRKGFTLIEMMAVIAIVAVLVAVIVPVVGKARVKAQAAADAANLRSLSATVATRYVTITDNDELSAGLEVPDSQLRDSKLILVYKDGNELQSYYADSLVGYSCYRGVPYNSRIATSGVIDEEWDDPEGTLLFVIGAGDYAGKPLTEILLDDYISYVTSEFEKGSATAEQAIRSEAGAYYDNNEAAIKKDAFAKAYANYMMQNAETKTENSGCTQVTKYKDANGNFVSEDDARQSYVSAGNAIVTEGYDYTVNSDNAAIQAGNNAANAVNKEEYVQDAVDDEWFEIGKSGFEQGGNAFVSGMDDVTGILGDSDLGEGYEEALGDISDSINKVWNDILKQMF